MSRARSTALDSLLLLILTAILIAPLFRIDYFNDWMSIEGSFIADARYIRDHWPHPAWDALWYCGNRFDYIYPPGTRYGAAIAAMLFHVVPARGYHIYTGLMYCLGVAGVYFLVRVGSGSRGAAWVAACAEALLSPEFTFLKDYRRDSALWMPERLNVLIKWGEGPHTCALALIPWAVAFTFLAFRRRRVWPAAAAALCYAAVVTNNFYGALALLIFFPLAVWSTFAAEKSSPPIWLVAAAIAALSAGLCAWWLTPSYIALTNRNLILVAYPGNLGSKVLGALLVLAFAAASFWAARRFRLSPWTVFVTGCALAFLVEVVGQFWFHFRIWGEPMRFVPELDMVLILALVALLQSIWNKRRWPAVALAVAGFTFSLRYLSSPWSVFIPDPNWRQRIEYRMPEWMNLHFPGSRVFVNGSVSLWYSTWRDIAQVEGASDQGMEQLMPALARYQIMVGDDGQRDVWWLQSLGADAFVVNGPASQEIYHGIRNPRKYTGLLPVVSDHDGDVIYRVPRKPGLARVVDEQRLAKLAPIPWSNEDRDQLRAYAETLEALPVAASYERPVIDEIHVTATTTPGQSILVQETYDRGWHAEVDGRPAPIAEDIMHFMRVRVTPGTHHLRFLYKPTTEARLGLGITLLSLVLVVGQALSLRRPLRPPAGSVKVC